MIVRINDTIFNVELIDIMQELKAQLYANGIQRFAKMFDSGEDLMVCCPYHKDGQERKPSCGIRKSDGLVHCLACGETHSLPEMISYCFGYNDPFGKQGYKWLIKNFASVEVREREAIKIDMVCNNISNKNSVLADSNIDKSFLFITDDKLDTYRYTHPYMYERGLTDDIIEMFDIGYDKKTDSITFPVRDINGDCMFVARRSVKTKHFDIPKGIEKPLYGMYELSRVICGGRGRPPIYVCEGLFDCLRLWCNGKYAVAGFGCLFSSYQIKQLQDMPFRTIILALDADKAGKQATERLRTALTNKLVYEVMLPQDRKDIGECTDEEIQNLEIVL